MDASLDWYYKCKEHTLIWEKLIIALEFLYLKRNNSKIIGQLSNVLKGTMDY